VIRPATAADAGPLLALMRELARFEGYDAVFALTPRDLLERGLAPAGPPQFTAFVGEGPAGLLGYAVVVEIPFTCDLRPTLLLKELFVEAGHRGGGIGRGLFERVRAHGRERGCGRLVWTVLPDNAPAQAFYRQAGGAPDAAWQHWKLPLN
jgi:GNAT superfamily N-acetyltransferase